MLFEQSHKEHVYAIVKTQLAFPLSEHNIII